MATRPILYTQPVGGAAAAYERKEGNRGLVPYFVSGPLSRRGFVGWFGTILHVAAWLLAAVFDFISAGYIHGDDAPGARTYNLYGMLAMLIGLGVLLAVTVLHFFKLYQVPEGGAPPFLMTLFIGGAQISLLLTILQMIMMGNGDTSTDFYFVNTTMTATEQADERTAVRNMLVWAMIAKVYIVQFLKNNQEWAGPAVALKEDADIVNKLGMSSAKGFPPA